MTGKAILAVAVSLALVGLAAPAAADHFGDPDRDAIYIGFSGVNHGLNSEWIPACESVFGEGDCPTPIPSGLISTSCDDEEYEEGLGFQGIGGVLFCAVPAGATISVALHDPVVDPVVASITCLESEGEVNWHVTMGTAEGSATFNLADDCPHEPAQHTADPEGTTRVGVFIQGPPDGAGATTGEATLNF